MQQSLGDKYKLALEQKDKFCHLLGKAACCKNSHLTLSSITVKCISQELKMYTSHNIFRNTTHFVPYTEYF